MSPPKELWCLDFEFQAPPGEHPIPWCLVAQEYHSGRQIRLWLGDGPVPCPIPAGPDSAVVAYYASAEMGCFLALGWDLPVQVLDLYAEFRNLTNGLKPVSGNTLLGALAYCGLDAMAAAEKAEMRALALRGGPYNAAERHALLDYCAEDVTATTRLLDALWPRIDWPRAFLRGRSMVAAARIEWTGVPLDVPYLHRLDSHWTAIQDQLIARIDAAYGIYEGRTFKRDRFAAYLAGQGIPWPRLDSDQLDLKDETFKDLARAYPVLQPLRELRLALGQMRLSKLAVGADGRNRVLLSAFQARTGRNQPSNSQFIFRFTHPFQTVTT
ncbi:MAG TPA: DNA polymerase I, partial [Chromatiaceae bacterium]|nr:DNA polymerase I [Chromatiaceae bacterium]